MKFRVDLPLNLELNLNVGQVFRWKRTPTGWEGWDDANHYRFEREEVEAPDEAALASLFRLDVPLERLHIELVQRGSELEPIIERWPDLRLMRPSSSREMLFTFLCTANNHLPRITAMVDKMAAMADIGFPSLERLQQVTETEWRSLGFGYRGKTIPLVVREVIARGGEAWMNELRAAPYAEVVRELETLPGVGPKLADCIALYAFDKTEAAPVDTHLWQAYQHVYGGPDTLTDARKRSVGDALRDRFGELAGFAQQFLFVDNLKRKER